MPFFPEIPTWNTATINTQQFLGLNRGLSIADGEMADMLNMTSDHYPVLATARPRGHHRWDAVDGGGVTTFAGAPSGMLGTDRLIVCHEDKVYMDGVQMPLTLSASEEMQPKHLVSMGAYVCIWPDKKYFNVTNPDDYGDMGTRWTAGDDQVISAMMCRKDGRDYDMESITISDTAPEDPADQQLWLDTSGGNDVLKQYSTIYNEWIQVATTYIKIQATGIGRGLNVSDVVFLTGTRIADDVGEAAVVDTVGDTLSFPVEEFNLTSTFSTGYNGAAYISSTPSIAERTKTVTVEGIPDGAIVTGAILKVTTTSSRYGERRLTVNGQALQIGENEIPVDVSGNGDVSLLFRFQSYNGATTSGQHSGVVKFKEMALEVSYATTASTDEQISKQLEALNTSNLLYGAGDDYIIVAGMLRRAVTLANSLVVERRIPDLDYICEANNRIWGCSYATVDGTLTNEIRCCALGDFRNWYRFEGTSMDSYVMSVGSDGKFTGAYALQGVPLMFKEGFLHKISGTQPSNFTLNTIRCRGVQDGSWRSLAAVNEVLMYKAPTDVMAYDGAMPYAVSEALGTERYYEAVGGAYRDKYYISMHTEGMAYSTYVFDTGKGLWHKEDEAPVAAMASVAGDLVLASMDGGEACLYNVSNPDGEDSMLPWSVTFGVFGYAYETSKYLSRFNIRAQMQAGSTMTLEIMYDSNGVWEPMGTMRSRTIRTFMLPVIPRRCDHCQVRISGVGNVKVYSIARVFEQGGN